MMTSMSLSILRFSVRSIVLLCTRLTFMDALSLSNDKYWQNWKLKSTDKIINRKILEQSSGEIRKIYQFDLKNPLHSDQDVPLNIALSSELKPWERRENLPLCLIFWMFSDLPLILLMLNCFHNLYMNTMYRLLALGTRVTMPSHLLWFFRTAICVACDLGFCLDWKFVSEIVVESKFIESVCSLVPDSTQWQPFFHSFGVYYSIALEYQFHYEFQ